MRGSSQDVVFGSYRTGPRFNLKQPSVEVRVGCSANNRNLTWRNQFYFLLNFFVHLERRRLFGYLVKTMHSQCQTYNHIVQGFNLLL